MVNDALEHEPLVLSRQMHIRTRSSFPSMTMTSGRYLPEHWLDTAIRAVGDDATPEQRLEVVWCAYEQETGIRLSRPPSAGQRVGIHAWLMAMRKHDNFPMFIARVPRMRTMLHLSMREKASRLAQSWCPSCDLVVQLDGKVPLNVTFPIAVEPWSRQSTKQAKKIRDAVHDELAERGICQPWSGSPLCLTIVSLVPAKTSGKDVDNLVKGLLDSMQGVLYPDDRLIQCLTTRRIEYAGPVGHYSVSARAVHPWDADVVHDDPAVPIIASGRRI